MGSVSLQPANQAPTQFQQAPQMYQQAPQMYQQAPQMYQQEVIRGPSYQQVASRPASVSVMPSGGQSFSAPTQFVQPQVVQQLQPQFMPHQQQFVQQQPQFAQQQPQFVQQKEVQQQPEQQLQQVEPVAVAAAEVPLEE